MSLITNRQRLLYILDTLKESFPESARIETCGCGDKEGPEKKVDKKVTTEDVKSMLYAIEGPMLCKRDLIERMLMEMYGAKNVKTFDEFLDTLSDQQIGIVISNFNVDKIDTHLHDLALFLDPARAIPTTFEEIKQWDKRHKNDNLLLPK
jgi:hypothetical protein